MLPNSDYKQQSYSQKKSYTPSSVVIFSYLVLYRE